MFDFLKKRTFETAPQPSAVNTEQIEYALQFESVLSNMEAHFRNSMDYRGVGINALKMVCEFYNGDWASVILAELDLSIWRPHWWYKPEDIDRTDELVHKFESCEGLERWVQCIRDNKPLIVSDVEAIKDSYPVEYDLYKRLPIDSFIAVPIAPKPTGFLVVRNPKKFVNQTSFVKMVSYAVGGTILETQLAESRKMMVAPKHIQNPNEIVIKLFGSIEIYTSRGVIYKEQIKSPKLCKLLVYLLLSKKTLHQPMTIADMKRNWEAKGVTSQIMPIAKARTLQRITSAMPQLSTDMQLIRLKTGWKQRSVSCVERQKATITRFTTLTNSKISKARNSGKSQWLPSIGKRLWCAGIATAVLFTKSEFSLNKQ